MQQEKIQNVTYIVSSDCKKCNASRKRERERERGEKKERKGETDGRDCKESLRAKAALIIQISQYSKN